MKVEFKILEITHDDLVNLFSTATYDSSYLSMGLPKGSYKGTELENVNDCVEDKWAKVLLNGGSVYVYDYYAEDEDEFYGNLPHEWNGNRMRYTITLEDIKRGLESCNKDEYLRKNLEELITEDIDLIGAENIMQQIVFGEVIYG